jgi:hypothetical protein
MFPFTAAPVDAVPSALEVCVVPLCEGIVVGLVLGATLLFVMSTIERLFAWWTGPQTADTQPADAPAPEVQPVATRRPAPRPVLGARALPTRPRRPAGPRPTLLAKLT